MYLPDFLSFSSSSRPLACLLYTSTNVLKYHPFLIKPNNHELGELFCLEFNTHEEVIPYAKELQKQGARNVLVSMGGKGAALVAENGEVYTSDAVKGLSLIHILSASRCQRSLPIRHYPPGKSTPLQLSGD